MKFKSNVDDVDDESDIFIAARKCELKQFCESFSVCSE